MLLLLRLLFLGRTILGGCRLPVSMGALRLEETSGRPRFAVFVRVRRLKTEHTSVAVLAGRGDDVVAPNVPRRPRDIPDQTPMDIDLDGEVELLGRRGHADVGVGLVARPVHLDRVHARHDEPQGLGLDTRPQRRVAGLRVRVEADLEANLLASPGPLADGELVDDAHLGQVLGLVVLVDHQPPVGGEERKVGLPGLLVVLDAEGPVRRLGRARVEGRAATGAAAEPATGCGGGVLGPEAEAALDAEGGYEVRIDGRREPLELTAFQHEHTVYWEKSHNDVAGVGFNLPRGPHHRGRSRCRTGAMCRPCAD